LAEALVLSGRLQFDGARYKTADYLLPVVRRAQAAELRAAAQHMPDPKAALWLTTRADTLEEIR
jgi:hypothetical protein